MSTPLAKRVPQAPRFLVTPRSKLVPEGSTVRFLCLVAGEPRPDIRWTRLPSEIPADATVGYLDENVSWLEIGRVRPWHAGCYQVRLSNVAGSVTSITQLQVLEKEFKPSASPPEVLVPLRDVVVHDGEPFSLALEISSHPAPSIVWCRDDQPLPPTSRDLNVFFDGVDTVLLSVREAFPEDGACFSCRIRNECGEAVTSCRVTVLEPGTDKECSTTEVIEAVRNEIESALPEVVEKKSSSVCGVTLDGGDDHHREALMIAVSAADGPLSVDRSLPSRLASCLSHLVRDHACRGLAPVFDVASSLARSQKTDGSVCLERALPARRWNVLWRNPLQQWSLPRPVKHAWPKPLLTTASLPAERIGPSAQESSFTLDTSAERRATSTGVILEIEPNRLTNAREETDCTGSTSTMSLQVSKSEQETADEDSSPVLQVEVSPVEQVCLKGQDITLHCAAMSTSLLNAPSETTEDDAGADRQQCRPEEWASPGGLEIPVLDRHVARIPAQIVRGPDNVVIGVGSDFHLRVYFIGVPTPIVTWIRGGKIVEEGGSLSIAGDDHYSQLSIRDSCCDDSGKYLMLVENCYGCDCCSVSVKVEGPPDPPVEGPTAVTKSTSCVEVTWPGSPFDGGCKIQRYLVDVSRADRELPRSWTRVSEELSTSCLVAGLEPGASYVFVVRAENVHGVSMASAESNTVTLRPLREQGSQDSVSEDDVVGDVDLRERFAEPVSTRPGSQFLELYKVHEEVGKGRFGVVHRCTRLSDGKAAAAKMVRCIRIVERDKLNHEIAIMNLLRGHPKLLELQAVFEKPKEMILVTEFVSGGELFERVIADDFVLTERDCIMFLRQICAGVAYMHSKNVVHLDLKPENILCQSQSSHKIKLIDFGLAQIYNPDSSLKVLFGTPEFVSPEVVNYEPVSPATDMWSVGVICYVLLSGLSPFMGDTDAETFNNVVRAEFDFDDEVFDKISQVAKDFICQLLLKNPKKRLTAEQCLKHEWLQVPKEDTRFIPLSTEKLNKFVVRRKWLKTGNALKALSRMVSITGMGPSSRPGGAHSPVRRGSNDGLPVPEEDSLNAANADVD